MSLNRIPSSLYRIQFSSRFTLKNAISILPYLNDLGIEGIYTSPIFDAIDPGGYNVTNPLILHPDLGTEKDLEQLSGTLKSYGMKWLFDVVPNHMGISGDQNPWWTDVLKKGQFSEYAPFFDIIWNPLKEELKGKVCLAILGKNYGLSLENQEFKLDWIDGGLWVQINGGKIPINDRSLPFFFSMLQSDDEKWQQCIRLAKETAENPLIEKKEALANLLNPHSPAFPQLQQLLQIINGKKNDSESFDLFHLLLEMQYYRLSHWRVAGQEINYRRFFNINELAAIHIEDEKVLQKHHSWIFELLEKKIIDGLRVDHPDGLYRPGEYFKKIRSENPAFIVVEKILNVHEDLPTDWEVDGTVGYEFLNFITKLYVKKTSEKAFSKIYEKFTGEKQGFDAVLYERKKIFIQYEMRCEINYLAYHLDKITEGFRITRDFTYPDLVRALEEIVCCYPVYRTYIDPTKAISEVDRKTFIYTIDLAKKRSPGLEPLIFDFIKSLFLLEKPLPEEVNAKAAQFILRFQQMTGPIMAKGMEDSAFFLYNRLIALNEVGGSPKMFGIPLKEFHDFNKHKFNKWPLGLLPGSTHDSKFSEDARLRIAVLSEIAKRWEETIFQWKLWNEKYKTSINGHLFPDTNTEYYLYQALLGIYTAGPEKEFKLRVQTIFKKIIREAGTYTQWHIPSPSHEEAMRSFIDAILTCDPSNLFFDSFANLAKEIDKYGKLNSLSSMILKMGGCGIFECYQGDENWNYSLVDPDNRREIDYSSLQNLFKKEPPSDWDKQRLLSKLLNIRKEEKELFLKGQYFPVHALGKRAKHVVAFLRTLGEKAILVASTRFFTEIPLNSTADFWEDTHLRLPQKIALSSLQEMLTKQEISVRDAGRYRSLDCKELFKRTFFSFYEKTS